MSPLKAILSHIICKMTAYPKVKFSSKTYLYEYFRMNF
jgi:hypothetical protein